MKCGEVIFKWTIPLSRHPTCVLLEAPSGTRLRSTALENACHKVCKCLFYFVRRSHSASQPETHVLACLATLTHALKTGKFSRVRVRVV